jgi:probable phosphoglycerate mutase
VAKIILTRHGHVEGIQPPRFRGRMELALTPEGRRQAQLTAQAIAARWKPAAVYASPMGRSRDTAAAIAAACGIGEAEILEGLNDLDYGEWQWRTHDEVRAASPTLFEAWRKAPQFVRFPGGESLQDLVARTGDVLRLVLARHADQTVVLVGHDSVNRALMLQVLGQPLNAFWSLSQDPCGITEFDLEGGESIVRRVNETAHLDAPTRHP